MGVPVFDPALLHDLERHHSTIWGPTSVQRCDGRALPVSFVELMS